MGTDDGFFFSKEQLDRIKKVITLENDETHLKTLSEKGYLIKQGQKEKYGNLQMVLAFDTTTSMGKYRKYVREKFDYIATNLTEMLNTIEISFAGVGEYRDYPNIVQIKPFSSEIDQMRKNLYSIKDTKGGGAGQVSLELLLRDLNRQVYKPGPKCLVFVSDQIPHGMDKKEKNPTVDYRKEIDELKKTMNFYFVSAIGNKRTEYIERMQNLQRQLVNNNKYFLDLKRLDTLPNIIIGMSMSEVGRLDYLMKNLEDVK
jgi:hypothetical protein